MSTTLVSAFYDFNDVIHQNKQRPAMLDLRQRPIERKPNNLLISRRHSTNSTNMSSLASPSFTKQHALSPSSSSFFPMPSSPKDPFLNSRMTESGLSSPLNIRERAQSASFQEELDAQHRKRSATNSSRYKTELCRPFEENGTCKYGDKCQFAHGFHELRGLNRHPKYKTEFCRTYHTIGFCPYGPRCHFIHNDEEKRLAQSQSGSGRSVSMSSMDSSPSSPVIDISPSPFGNLTPPTSPGGFGDVFVFDDATTTHVPTLPTTKTTTMTTIPETSSQQQQFPITTRSSSVSSPFIPKSPSPITNSIPMMTEEARDINTFQPIQTKMEERNTILTPPDSGSSNPPSPTDSIDGANRRRLPVFGLMKQ